MQYSEPMELVSRDETAPLLEYSDDGLKVAVKSVKCVFPTNTDGRQPTYSHRVGLFQKDSQHNKSADRRNRQVGVLYLTINGYPLAICTLQVTRRLQALFASQLHSKKRVPTPHKCGHSNSPTEGRCLLWVNTIRIVSFIPAMG